MDASGASGRGDAAALGALLGLFLALNLPAMFREAPGMDEDLYAVPGIAVARAGIPAIPFLPTRDPRTFYYGVDVALYTLPPLGFYLQAPAFLLLPGGIGPARLASCAAGFVAVATIHGLALRWTSSRRAALLAAAALLFSRPFLFPALTARPDMAAAALGFLAIALVARPGGPRPVAAGLAAGLGGLAHPFGVAPFVQAGLALPLGAGSPRRRLGRVGRFGAAAVAALGLWGPLIALHPGLFWHQFRGNVLGRAGSGLGRTLLDPGPVLAFQAGQILDRAGPPQFALAAAATLWALWSARRPGPARELASHLVAGALLLVLFMGRHPLLGYFAYPAGFVAIAAGGMIDRAIARLEGPAGRRWWGTLLAAALLAAILAPGAGLRRVAAHYRHLGDPQYDHRTIARAVMADLDPAARVAADQPFVLEFHLAGRPVIDALYLRYLPPDFEFVVLGPGGLERCHIAAEDLTPVRRYGDPADPFAPAAELWRRRPGAQVWREP